MKLPSSIASRVRGVMRLEHEVRLARRAVDAGLLRSDALAAAIAEAEQGGGGVFDRLTARGLLAPADLDRLRAEVAREDFARPSLRAVPALPPEAAVAAGEPGRRLDDFILVAPIGRGGAGEVWRAWDTALGRWVAVKLPVAASLVAASAERFAREALAAARLDHPNIVPLYRAGTSAEGRPYLVMPLVDGRTLDHVALPPERVLEVMRTVALAVHHAHERGVTHRDLKPGNLMLADDGRVFILDFGLGYLAGDERARMTEPGDVVGTAAYLSPEQAAGAPESRLPTSDVYGLGATLYQLLAGRPPFAGETLAEIVAKVLRDEPPSLRAVAPQIGPGAAAVVAKAMRKDHRHRYPSAAALAEDLRRLLAGEPIVARPDRWASRQWRRARRAPAVVAASVAGLALVAALTGVGLVSRERRAALETARALAALSLDSALQLRRSGDAAGMRRTLPALLDAYRRASEGGARSAELEHLMGRVHRVLMDDARALEHQQRALALDPALAGARYERVVLRARAYDRARARALALAPDAGGPLGPSRIGERRPIPSPAAAAELAGLRRAIGDDLTGLTAATIGDARARAARAIVAYHDEQFAAAAAELRRVIAADPSLDEAWETLARSLWAMGQHGEVQAICSAGLARDAGNVALLLGRCQARSDAGAHDTAEQDATRALAFLPELPEARQCRATARSSLGHAALVRGRDPEPFFAGAERDLTALLQREPDSVAALRGLGVLYRYRALAALRTGGDARPALKAAEATMDRAIALAPQEGMLWPQRGRVRTMSAIDQWRRGEDPMATLAAAEADLTQGLALEDRGESWHWRGEVRALRARYLFESGRDAREAFAAAEEDLAGPASWRRGNGWPVLHRAVMRTHRARAERAAGRDASAIARGAFQDFERAAVELPDQAEVWTARARLAIDEGCARGPRRGPDLDAAAASLDRALALNARFAEAWLERGRLALCLGQPRAAEEALAQALAHDRGLARDAASLRVRGR